jgi:hypothetical protein
MLARRVLSMRRLALIIVSVVCVALFAGCGSDPADPIIGLPDPTDPTDPIDPVDPLSIATNTCAGQPKLALTESEFVIPAFPRGQDQFTADFQGIGACTAPGNWVADSVVCFVPSKACTFSVGFNPRGGDTIAGIVAAGPSCQPVMPTTGVTSCLGVKVGFSPGARLDLRFLTVLPGQVVCAATRSAGNGSGAVDVEITGLDECGDLR